MDLEWSDVDKYPDPQIENDLLNYGEKIKWFYSMKKTVEDEI